MGPNGIFTGLLWGPALNGEKSPLVDLYATFISKVPSKLQGTIQKEFLDLFAIIASISIQILKTLACSHENKIDEIACCSLTMCSDSWKVWNIYTLVKAAPKIITYHFIPLLHEHLVQEPDHIGLHLIHPIQHGNCDLSVNFLYIL